MSAPELRRSLAEVMVLHELEPTLKNVYVEGESDCAILEWFFERKGKRDVRVYAIDTVTIPGDVIASLKLNPGSQRDKLMALAEKLSKVSGSLTFKVRCIADADYDRYLGRCRSNCILEYTDYTCMDMYLFHEDLIRKFVTSLLPGSRVCASGLLTSLAHTLQRVFLIRLANEKLNWNMSWLVNFRRYVSFTGNKVQFQEEAFIRSYLGKNSRLSQLHRFVTVLQDFEGRVDSDPRHSMRGHDFTHLLFLFVKKRRGHARGFKDDGTLQCALCVGLELPFVDDEPLFVKLGLL